MSRIYLSAALCLSSIGLVTACARQPAVPEGMVRVELPRCEVEDRSRASACDIRVFDGTATNAAQRGGDGAPYLVVERETVTLPRVAIFSAPDHEPRIQALRTVNTSALPPVVLVKAADRRGGYLAGIVYRTSDEKMDGNACGIESFLAQRSVVIERAPERREVTTDNVGGFVVALPAGQITVNVANEHRRIDIVPGDTQWVVIAVSQTSNLPTLK